MSWREQYQRGSFRGAPFRTVEHEASGGRRNVVTELPGRDAPVLEDMGARATSFSVDIWVGGEEYMAARDQLRVALDKKGSGTLVHPWWGRMQVSVMDWTCTESTEEGGIAHFSVNFSEAGIAIARTGSADGQLLSIDAADAAIRNAPATFASRFSVDRSPGFVEDNAGRLIAGIAAFTQDTAGIGGGVGPALRTFEAGLSLLAAPHLSGAGGLLRNPSELARVIIALVQAVSLIGGPSRRRIAAFTAMVAYDPANDASLGSALGASAAFTVATAPTPNRRVEVGNRDALVHLFRIAASAELVRTIAGARFASQDEALALKNSVNGLLENAATIAADAGDDSRMGDIDALRRALVRDISLRAPQLPALRTLDISASEPAIVIANRLSGHALAESQAADLVDRNAIAHPAFVPAPASLKVIANG